MSDSKSEMPRPEVDEWRANHDLDVKAGQDTIARHWRSLEEDTKKFLTSMNFYTDTGKRRVVSEWDAASDHRLIFETLEANLGILSRHITSPPNTPRKGEKLPPESRSERVVAACVELVSMRECRDPEFYYLALCALGVSRLGDAEISLPIYEPPATWVRVAQGIGRFTLLAGGGLLVLLAPLLAAYAMVSAAEGSLAGATVGMYGLGLAYLLQTRRNRLMDEWDAEMMGLTPQQKTCRAWRDFTHELYDYKMGGVGAAAYLLKIQGNGVDVPPVAFDLCAAHAATTVYRRLPEVPPRTSSSKPE